MTSGFYCSQPADSAEQRSCPRGRRKVKRKPLWSWIQLSLEPGQQRLFSSLFLSLFHLPRHVQINVTSHRPALQTKLGTPHATHCQNLCARCRQQRARVFYHFNTIFFCFLMDWNQQHLFLTANKIENIYPSHHQGWMLNWWVSFVMKWVVRFCQQV